VEKMMTTRRFRPAMLLFLALLGVSGSARQAVAPSGKPRLALLFRGPEFSVIGAR
jgi:hypothetical protein